jgi:hypothetical protein
LRDPHAWWKQKLFVCMSQFLHVVPCRPPRGLISGFFFFQNFFLAKKGKPNIPWISPLLCEQLFVKSRDVFDDDNPCLRLWAKETSCCFNRACRLRESSSWRSKNGFYLILIPVFSALVNRLKQLGFLQAFKICMASIQGIITQLPFQWPITQAQFFSIFTIWHLLLPKWLLYLTRRRYLNAHPFLVFKDPQES